MGRPQRHRSGSNRWTVRLHRWVELGSFQLPLDREDLKARLAAVYPEKKPGAIPGDAAVLAKFAEGMQAGDYIISPQKADRTLNFGVVTGGFYRVEEAETHRNRRTVNWVTVGASCEDGRGSG